MANVHLAMLSGNEYLVAEGPEGTLKRRVRGPKSLVPHLTVLADELVGAYRNGFTIVDGSMAPGAAGRTFTCRVVLLYWTGDYPAQALASGTHSKMCHWCTLHSVHAPEISRRCWCDYRRYLPEGHDMRAHAGFGAPEMRFPPPPRTHAGYMRAAKQNRNYRGPEKNAPYKRTGVKWLSPLAAVPLMDMVWDFLPDMMHIVQGIWKQHIFKMFRGERTPARPKRRKTWTDKANDDLMMQHRLVLEQMPRWELEPEARRKLDARSLALGGEAGWLQNNIRVCGNCSTLKAHDWLVLMHSAGRYLLRDVFPAGSDRSRCILALQEACAMCLSATSSYNSENREEIDRVKQRVIEALCLVEACVPRTELPVMFHLLLHVSDAIYRWNAVRNFWCFFNERSVKFFYILFTLCMHFSFYTFSTLCTHTIFM